MSSAGVDVLTKSVPIVDRAGQPTKEFQIKWAQLADTLGVIPRTAAQVSALLDKITSTKGDILVRGASAWQELAIGTTGQVLQVVAGLPSWQTPSFLPTINDGDLLANTSGAPAIPVDTTVSALLDYVFGSSQGDILFRGGTVWKVLAPGSAGEFLQTQGAGAPPQWAAASSGSGSGGLFSEVMSVLPTQVGTGLTTQVATTGMTVANVTTGISIVAPSSANAFGMLTKPAPTTPYSITALVSLATVATSFPTVGIGWYDGSSKIHTIAATFDNGAPGRLGVSKFNSPTSYDADDFTGQNIGWPNPVWMQIADDGTDVHFRFSADGATFEEIFSIAKSSGWLGASGYSNVFFGINNNGQNAVASLLSWGPPGGTPGGGTVTSVGLSLPSQFTVSGSPVTASGVLTAAWVAEAINVVFAGPASGSSATPTFRALVPADVPTLNQNTTGNAATATALNPGATINGVAFTGASNITVTTALHLLSDVNVTEGAPIDGYTLNWNNAAGKWEAVAPLTPGSGTVTSVALTAPAEFNVAGSPITNSGTLAISKATQPANEVWAGPTSGGSAAPAFRALVANDIPSLSGLYDPLGAAATAQTNAEAFAANASNISSGTLNGARLPNPSVSVLGGVESATAPANEFMTGISTSGVPQFAQPSFTELSGNASLSQLPLPNFQGQFIWSVTPTSIVWSVSLGSTLQKLLSEDTLSSGGVSLGSVTDALITSMDSFDSVASVSYFVYDLGLIIVATVSTVLLQLASAASSILNAVSLGLVADVGIVAIDDLDLTIRTSYFKYDIGSLLQVNDLGHIGVYS